MNINKAVVAVLLGAFLLSACGGSSLGLQRVQGPNDTQGLPRIDALLDLGALALPAGDLPSSLADGVFTPGEYVAVQGAHLHAAQFTLGGKSVAVTGYLNGGGVLVRLPRGISVNQPLALEARTQGGATRRPLSLRAYLVATDTDANRTTFLPMGPDFPKGLGKEPSFVPLQRALLHALHEDGGVVFAAGVESRTKADARSMQHQVALQSIHLGAAGGPRLVNTIALSVKGRPRALVALSSVLFLGTDAELVVLDVSEPGSPRESARIALPAPPDGQAQLAGFVPCDDGLLLAVDLWRDHFIRIDVADVRAPKVLDVVDLARGAMPRTQVLATDPVDARRVWVLEGPSTRGAEKKLRGWIDTATSALSLRREGDGHGSGTGESARVPPALSVYEVDRAGITRKSSHALPATLLPIGLIGNPEGGVFVSGAAGDDLDWSKVTADTDGVGEAIGNLVKLGRVGTLLAISDTGKITQRLEGMALFVAMSPLPGGEVAYAGVRLSPTIRPPFVGVQWMLGVEAQGALGLRKLGFEYALPPYQPTSLTAQQSAPSKVAVGLKSSAISPSGT